MWRTCYPGSKLRLRDIHCLYLFDMIMRYIIGLLCSTCSKRFVDNSTDQQPLFSSLLLHYNLCQCAGAFFFVFKRNTKHWPPLKYEATSLLTAMSVGLLPPLTKLWKIIFSVVSVPQSFCPQERVPMWPLSVIHSLDLTAHCAAPLPALAPAPTSQVCETW